MRKGRWGCVIHVNCKVSRMVDMSLSLWTNQPALKYKTSTLCIFIGNEIRKWIINVNGMNMINQLLIISVARGLLSVLDQFPALFSQLISTIDK